MRAIAILAFVLGVTVSAADAATLVTFTGNATGAMATGTASITLDGSGNTITGTLTNTSPFDARITGFGFDIRPGNLAGYVGTPDPIILPVGVNFDFRDDDLGNVPQFNSIVLDFGYVTGPNPNFTSGFPNEGLAPSQMLNFMVSGSFAGLTEQEIASALVLRFQRVGPNGELSDVAVAGSPGTPTPFSSIPEPASMLLVGSGPAYLARRRCRVEELSRPDARSARRPLDDRPADRRRRSRRNEAATKRRRNQKQVVDEPVHSAHPPEDTDACAASLHWGRRPLGRNSVAERESVQRARVRRVCRWFATCEPGVSHWAGGRISRCAGITYRAVCRGRMN